MGTGSSSPIQSMTSTKTGFSSSRLPYELDEAALQYVCVADMEMICPRISTCMIAVYWSYQMSTENAAEMEPFIMRKNIATVIAAIASIIAIGTAGALECDTITLSEALIRLVICAGTIFSVSRDLME